ncbi:MAG: phytoene/squalene synthase family protein [Rubripirellula sp.]|nr:phytoene/squalene synthase family protein [Rubripirellula sp.]
MNFEATCVDRDFDDVPESLGSVIQKHSRSFSFASCLLPRHIRDDVRKLYAWCRWCDDAVDSASTLAEAKIRLETLQADVDRIYRGEQVRHRSSQWLAELVDRHGIRKDYPVALLDAMAMDLELGQIQSERELLRYCYGAAGVVGLMLCQIFDVRDARAFHHASALGTAMQLTNIARDVLEDSHRRRCYLPSDWLGGDIDSVGEGEIRRVVQKMLDVAEGYYQTAEAGMHYLPGGVRPAIRVAAAVYREIGTEIRRQEYEVMRGRIITPKTRFVATAVSASVRGVTVDVRQYVAAATSSLLPFTDLQPFHLQSDNAMNDAKYIAWLGLSLTAFMGGALFLLVLLNPKDASYSYLPLIYCIGCFAFGGIANFFAKQHEDASASQVPIPVRSTED